MRKTTINVWADDLQLITAIGRLGGVSNPQLARDMLHAFARAILASPPDEFVERIRERYRRAVPVLEQLVQGAI